MYGQPTAEQLAEMEKTSRLSVQAQCWQMFAMSSLTARVQMRHMREKYEQGADHSQEDQILAACDADAMVLQMLKRYPHMKYNGQK